MVRKKRVKRKSKSAKSNLVRATKKKLSLVLRNMIMFLVLFVISFILYNVSGKEFYQDLFFVLSMVFGFVSIALLIVLLILLFMRMLKK